MQEKYIHDMFSKWEIFKTIFLQKGHWNYEELKNWSKSTKIRDICGEIYFVALIENYFRMKISKQYETRWFDMTFFSQKRTNWFLPEKNLHFFFISFSILIRMIMRLTQSAVGNESAIFMAKIICADSWNENVCIWQRSSNETILRNSGD